MNVKKIKFRRIDIFSFLFFCLCFPREGGFVKGTIKMSPWIYAFIKPLINVSFLRFWETFSKKEKISIPRNLILKTLRNLHVDWVKFADSVMRGDEVDICKHSKNCSQNIILANHKFAYGGTTFIWIVSSIVHNDHCVKFNYARWNVCHLATRTTWPHAIWSITKEVLIMLFPPQRLYFYVIARRENVTSNIRATLSNFSATLVLTKMVSYL